MVSHSVADWISELTSRDPAVRLEAREHIPALSAQDIPTVAALLYHPERFVRWEAAKTLTQLQHPSTISPLIDALDDVDADVRWTAADALIAQGPDTIAPLLGTLIRRSGSVEFCEAAHHILRELMRRYHEPSLRPVLEALDREEPAVHVPVAAWHVLRKKTPGL